MLAAAKNYHGIAYPNHFCSKEVMIQHMDGLFDKNTEKELDKAKLVWRRMFTALEQAIQTCKLSCASLQKYIKQKNDKKQKDIKDKTKAAEKEALAK
eukprot:501903-Alexandrium_andersonii.AAC.1